MMEETKSQVGETEKVDELIAARLTERQRKIERMKVWEAVPTSRRKWVMTISTMSVAACMAMAFFALHPADSISTSGNATELMARPEITAYRAACPELATVESRMDAGDYEAAMMECEKVLHNSNAVLKEVEGTTMQGIDDEELEYELAAKSTENHDIRWIYIYLLLHNGRNEEAIKQIDICMKDEQCCDHIDEAAALKRKLKNN